MKETGIIMSGNHPKLILDGIKTMTRRVIKPQPFKGAWNATAEHPSYGWFWKKLYQTWEGEEDFFKRLVELCPYGQVGDRLWVKETWAVNPTMDGKSPRDISSVAFVYYQAASQGSPLLIGKWRSSRFMPRWASRITLEITEVRVERLQEITFDDCIKEGISLAGKLHISTEDTVMDYVLYFKDLWDSLNAKRGYSWVSNPWVWCVSFKRTE